MRNALTTLQAEVAELDRRAGTKLVEHDEMMRALQVQGEKSVQIDALTKAFNTLQSDMAELGMRTGAKLVEHDERVRALQVQGETFVRGDALPRALHTLHSEMAELEMRTRAKLDAHHKEVRALQVQADAARLEVVVAEINYDEVGAKIDYDKVMRGVLAEINYDEVGAKIDYDKVMRGVVAEFSYDEVGAKIDYDKVMRGVVAESGPGNSPVEANATASAMLEEGEPIRKAWADLESEDGEVEPDDPTIKQHDCADAVEEPDDPTIEQHASADAVGVKPRKRNRKAKKQHSGKDSKDAILEELRAKEQRQNIEIIDILRVRRGWQCEVCTPLELCSRCTAALHRF